MTSRAVSACTSPATSLAKPTSAGALSSTTMLSCCSTRTTARSPLRCRRLPAALVISPVGSGWYQRAVAGVGAGARYTLCIDDRVTVPDPASRANPDGVHAPSSVVDPAAYVWRDDGWRGRSWTQAVVYEIH